MLAVVRKIGWLIAALSLCACSGTGEKEAHTAITTGLKEVQSATGVILPSDAVIMHQGDLDRPDGSYYEWLLRSKSDLKILLRQRSERPLAEAVRLIESRLDKKKIPNAEKAYAGQWTNGGYAFSGALVEAPEANYLLIMRFRTAAAKK